MSSQPNFPEYLYYPLASVRTRDIKIINLDGKTSRGSYDRENKLKALHSVTAWAAEHHLVLAQHWSLD